MFSKYRKVVLKVSGESLSGSSTFGFDAKFIDGICDSIKQVKDLGVQILVVLGGGNFWRGRNELLLDRTKSDQVGMMASVMNAIVFSELLAAKGLGVKLLTALSIPEIAEQYTAEIAKKHIDLDQIVVLAGGMGNPFFTSDTAAAIRCAEIGADIVLKATSIDGVYNADPRKETTAIRYARMTFDELLKNKLSVIDLSAAAICLEHDIPFLVFSITDPDNIFRAVTGEQIGTIITL